MLVQNMACVEVNLDPKSRRYYFEEDILDSDAIVDNIVLFFDNPNANIIFKTGNPFSLLLGDGNSAITSSANISGNGLFLNLSDLKGEFVSNLYFKNIQSVRGFTDNIHVFNIGRRIDTRSCYFNYVVNAPVRFLMYISYKNKPILLTNKIITGSFDVVIPINPAIQYQDILLSDYVPQNYKSRKIKKISIDNGLYAYLYLKTDNHLIENIPLRFLQAPPLKSDIYFDNLNIDYTQSFLKFRNSFPSQMSNYRLTFYY